MKKTTPQYTYDLNGLKEKYGSELQAECHRNLISCLGQINTIGVMANLRSIIGLTVGTDNPFIFKIHLHNNITLTAERFGWFNNQYIISYQDFKFNTYSNTDTGLIAYLKQLYVTPFQECQYRVNTHDTTYQYADDHRSYASGESNRTKTNQLYTTLSESEKAAIKQLPNAQYFNFN